MKISIAGQDYSSALDTTQPLTIERRLNEPSACELCLCLPPSGTLASPQRNQALAIAGDDGTVYFTGYIASYPLSEYVGTGLDGPHYRTTLQALSDEMLLDQVSVAPGRGASGQSAGTLMTSLVTRTGASVLSTRGVTLNTPVSQFVPEPGAVWSKSAGQIANQARATYRTLNGSLSISSVPASSHSLNETDGTLNLAALSFSPSTGRALANDITVCGAPEPAAYVTEYFLGDGVTTSFYLSASPFSLSASQSAIISELFNEPQIDQCVWNDPGGYGYLALGPGGLVMNGGNGLDGQTLLTWLDPVEMGGTLLLEAAGVTLSPGSTGILSGFFAGTETQNGCVAGFQVTAQQGTGKVSLQPLVQGVPTGSTFAVNPANQYTLRLRVHCAENQRILSVYRSFGDEGPIVCGGEWALTAAKVQLEVQEFSNGVGGMPVTLYDGAVSSLPSACSVVAASSINLIGTMRGLNLTSLGSAWVVSTPQGGGAFTRRLGTSTQAAECEVGRTGKLTFYTGYLPAAGEQIAVSYRTIKRAVGRAVNCASQQALAQSGLPPVLCWIGSVTSPKPRSSADCRNAAAAMGQAAAGVSALWRGSYAVPNTSLDSDVWPGDALDLTLPSANVSAQVVVRTVKLSYQPTYPDQVNYAITFANDWAEDLAIKTSATVPEDTWLPAPIAPTLLANLNALTVTGISGTSIALNAGATPPVGGGFEIRRSDYTFMPGEDPGLVLRTSAQIMTVPRSSANDKFFVRMYDGATPPNYSEFSAALFVNLPFGS